MAKDHNIDLFLETSSKTGFNTQEVFVKAAQMLLDCFTKYESEGRESNMSEKSSSTISGQEDNDPEFEKDNDDKTRCKKCCWNNKYLYLINEILTIIDI